MGRMAPVIRPRLLDGKESNTDALGISYVVIAIVYTIILALELTLLYRRRDAFCIQIRSIKIVFAAVSMLHVYLTLVLLAYPWNGLYPCSAEFWVMSVFLPSGMAFFQGKHEHRSSCIGADPKSLQCQGSYSIREPTSDDSQLP